MTSLSFQTAVQKNEAEFFCSVWKRNGVISCSVTEQSTTSYVLTVLKHDDMQSDVIAYTVLSDNAPLAQWEIIDTTF